MDALTISEAVIIIIFNPLTLCAYLLDQFEVPNNIKLICMYAKMKLTIVRGKYFATISYFQFKELPTHWQIVLVNDYTTFYLNPWLWFSRLLLKT